MFFGHSKFWFFGILKIFGYIRADLVCKCMFKIKKIKLAFYSFALFICRAHRDYWEKLNPSTGRPFSASLSKPDAWGVTKGDEILKQQTETTTDEEIANLRKARNGH